MAKAKVSEDEIKKLVNDETWFSGNENDDMFIGNFFNINYLDEEKEVVACVSKDLFKNYKHIPKTLKEVPKQPNVVKNKEPKQETAEENQKIDYTSFEEKINSLKGGN
jgi:hypothetical protein